MNPVIRILSLALVLVVSVGTAARAEMVIFDDHTDLSTLVVDPFLPNWVGGNAFAGLYSVVGVPIVGDGTTISTIGIVFGTQNGLQMPNQGDIHSLTWKAGFYPTLQDLLEDPVDTTGIGGAQFVEFATPSNPGWEAVIGQIDGVDLRYAEVSVMFPTTPGFTHVVSLFAIDRGQIPGTAVGIPFSTAGEGIAPHYLTDNIFADGTILVGDLGGPSTFGAVKVLGVTSIPEPGAFQSMAIMVMVGYCFKKVRR